MSGVDQAELKQILEVTEPIWAELRGKRIFITGGTGFIGTWLLESFAYANRKLDLHAQAVLLSRDPEAFRRRSPHLAEDPAISLVRGDVRDFVYPPGEFAFILHAATDASAWLTANHPETMLSTIVRGTEHVLAFAGQAATRKLLMLSSGAVYGTQPLNLDQLDEDYTGAPSPTHRGSVYGEGKRFAELLCALSEVSELGIKIARCFSFIGPYLPLDTHFAAGNFLADTLARRPIAIQGDGLSVRSYLYASDLVVWLWTILFLGQPLRPYNVGSESGVTVRELAETTAAISGLDLEVKVLGLNRSASTRYLPSTARARQELGLTQTVGLEDALQRTLHWHRLNSYKTAH